MHHSPINMATGGTGDISLPDVSKLNDLKDEQIEALIEKLAEVQAHAPQIIAALEAQQEARSRGSKGSKGGRSLSPTRQQPPHHNHHGHHHEDLIPEEEEEEEDDDEDYDEDEDDDDFDEDAEYPMVGDGYSDELSVVSDMTTPTVVSCMEVNEEEHYRDMVIGGMKVGAPKKKDLLASVGKINTRKGAAVAAAAAAAPKKKNALAGTKPTRGTSSRMVAADGDAAPKKKKSKDPSKASAGAAATGTKKVKKKVVKKSAAGEGSSSSGRKTAGKGPQGSSGSKAGGPVMIDDDGFLVDQSTFESFDSANNPFSSPNVFAGDSGDDDGFGAFGDFGNKSPAPKKAGSKPKKLNVAASGKKKSSGSSQTGGPSSPKTKRKGTRRASVSGT